MQDYHPIPPKIHSFLQYHPKYTHFYHTTQKTHFYYTAQYTVKTQNIYPTLQLQIILKSFFFLLSAK